MHGSDFIYILRFLMRYNLKEHLQIVFIFVSTPFIMTANGIMSMIIIARQIRV